MTNDFTTHIPPSTFEEIRYSTEVCGGDNHVFSPPALDQFTIHCQCGANTMTATRAADGGYDTKLTTP